MYEIKLVQGASSLALQGPGVELPGRSAILLPAYGEDEQLGQEIELTLEGTPAEIEGRLVELGRWLAAAGQQAELPGGAFVYLEVTAYAGGAAWRSKVLGGVLALLGGGAAQRGEGSQGVRLALRRVNYWEGARVGLALLGGGVFTTNAITLLNHSDFDPGHRNATYCEPAHVTGELPAPVELLFRSGDTDANGQLFAAAFASPDPLQMHTHPYFEGEDGTAGAGVTGTVFTNQAAASAQKTYRAAWNGDQELTLWRSPLLHEAWYRAMTGRAFLPVLRLASMIASDKIFLRWRVLVDHGGVLGAVHDTAGVFAPNGRNLAACAPVFLPPWPVGGADTMPPTVIELRGSGVTGAHQVDIDFIQLLALDSWRIYRSAFTVGAGLQVWDDPYGDRLRQLDRATQAHTAEGPGLWVTPNKQNHFCFLWEKAGGGWSALGTASVQAFYRPRKRVL